MVKGVWSLVVLYRSPIPVTLTELKRENEEGLPEKLLRNNSKFELYAFKIISIIILCRHLSLPLCPSLSLPPYFSLSSSTLYLSPSLSLSLPPYPLSLFPLSSSPPPLSLPSLFLSSPSLSLSLPSLFLSSPISPVSERDSTPRMAIPGTPEYDFAMRWKNLYNAEAKVRDEVEGQLKDQRRFLEGETDQFHHLENATILRQR